MKHEIAIITKDYVAIVFTLKDDSEVMYRETKLKQTIDHKPVDISLKLHKDIMKTVRHLRLIEPKMNLH